MSRFSKAEAEALGWNFTHSKPEETVVTSEIQGETRLYPASVRAEKYVAVPGRGSKLINEEAESLGLLLERIAAYERFIGQITTETEPAPVDTSGAIGTVTLPGGEVVTEVEFAARRQNDTLLVRDESGAVVQKVYVGGVEAVESSLAERELNAAEAENAAKAEQDFGPTEQLVYSTADNIDSPGQSAGGTLIVREGESVEDVSLRRDAEKSDAESERVNPSLEVLEDAPAEEPEADSDDE